MAYFPHGSIEEEILADTQYTQRQKGASNIEIVKALISVLEYYANEIESAKRPLIKFTIPLIKFTIPLPPISKKNSQRILYRWARDRSNGRQKRVPYIAPSEAFETYQQSALWFVPKDKQINTPVNVKCLFYMPDRRKVDLTNLLEAVDDIMVTAGLLADDNYTVVESHDGSRVLYDKANPRTEIYIELIERGNE